MFSQEKNIPNYLNTDLGIDERVNDVIARMTLEEKINQMKYNSPAIERLGIQEYNWWNECLHGVARAGVATVFPQALNLAAAFDADMMTDVAAAISDEARAKHNYFVSKNRRGMYQGLTFWSPNINIFRDPRWGRGHETYGEDPYLTGQLGLNFVKALQGDDEKYLKLVATPKHFAVHSGPEKERHTFDARVSLRDLKDTYLPAFRTCVIEGKAFSVMCAYNRFFGEPCCGNNKLLSKILRDEWGFEGYVVSDCGAVEDFYQNHKTSKTVEEAVSIAVKNGADLNCGDCYPSLIDAVKQNLISEKEIDIAVKRLFKARFMLGMFDPLEMVSYNKIPFSVNNCDKHDALALEAARKSIVLLKNDNILPLKKELKKVAVIGPNADDVEVLLGNYNGTPKNPVTVFAGIKKKLGNNAEVVYSQGCCITDSFLNYDVVPENCFVTESGSSGLSAEYFNNKEPNGDPDLIRNERLIDFNWWSNTPDGKIIKDNFSARFSGYLVPKKSGKYSFITKELWSCKFYFDGELACSNGDNKPEFTAYLEAGKKYKIKFEFSSYVEDFYAQLLWAREDDLMLEKAVELAKKSDVVIAALGLHPGIEGEEMPINCKGFIGGDRTDIEMPETQLNLLKALHGTGKPVILILMNGGAMAVNWANDNIPGIIQVGYPGQRGGDAVADVLFGDYNPAGRLPVTYYKSIDQIPEFENYNMKGRTYRYFEGEPLYPFGYGLSYTKFRYTDLKISEKTIHPNDNLRISVYVENLGAHDGDEVVQLYVAQKKSKYPLPKYSLQGFKRINLKKGEKKLVEFILTPRQFSVIDDENERVVEPGEFEVFIGGGQPGFVNIDTGEIISAGFKVEGNMYLIEEHEK